MFTHRRRADMDGFLPVGKVPPGGEFALAVVQHRPERDLAYLRERDRVSRQYGVENGLWFSFGPVAFVNDTADGEWHTILVRVLTDLAGKKPSVKLHVEVRRPRDCGDDGPIGEQKIVNTSTCIVNPDISVIMSE